eukprot:494915-Rhodomonas_salina.1
MRRAVLSRRMVWAGRCCERWRNSWPPSRSLCPYTMCLHYSLPDVPPRPYDPMLAGRAAGFHAPTLGPTIRPYACSTETEITCAAESRRQLELLHERIAAIGPQVDDIRGLLQGVIYSTGHTVELHERLAGTDVLWYSCIRACCGTETDSRLYQEGKEYSSKQLESVQQAFAMRCRVLRLGNRVPDYAMPGTEIEMVSGNPRILRSVILLCIVRLRQGIRLPAATAYGGDRGEEKGGDRATARRERRAGGRGERESEGGSTGGSKGGRAGGSEGDDAGDGG